MRFLIAGGSGLVGRDLIDELHRREHEAIVLSRTPSPPESFSYAELGKRNVDVLINLIGGYKSRQSGAEYRLAMDLSFELARISEMRQIPLYHVSSGAVFLPKNRPLKSCDSLHAAQFESSYTKLKVEIETMHRIKFPAARIVDVRIFSFVGNHFLNSGDYFVSELYRAIRDSNPITVNNRDFLRDVAGARELVDFFEATNPSLESNSVFNLYSKEPVSKWDLLTHLKERWGLNYIVNEEPRAETQFYCCEPEPGINGFTPRKSLEVIDYCFEYSFGQP